MAENATTEAAKSEPVKLTLEDYFKKTGLPDGALKPITDKVAEYNSLVRENNQRILKVNAAKAQDPNNVEYLDKLWNEHAEDDEEIAAIEPKYQALVEETEKLRKQLRELAKKHIQAPLSEDEARETKKLINETAPVIAEARTGLAAQFAIPESMLSLQQIAIPDGGLVTLLPQPDSLKNTRGRKAAGASGETRSYATRVGDVLIDGKSTAINGKGRFEYAANVLSERFGKSQNAANEVTAEELEEAFFKAMGKEFRSVKSTELQDSFTFDFTKVTKRQNPNDDSTTDIPVTVKVTVNSVNNKPAAAVEKTENKQDENKAPENKSETAKQEVPAPAKTEATKKTAAPAKK